MVAWTAHNTEKFSDWLIIQNQVFSLVAMLMSITQSLCDSPNQNFTTHTAHTYIYVTHLKFCGRIFKHTILKVQYNKKRNTRTKEHAKL